MLLYLSYRRHDHARVRSIASHLEKSGFSIWWDDLLVAGDAFERQLAAKLSEADVVVSFLTHNSMSALQQREEFVVAQKTGKRILPVRLDGVNIDDIAFARNATWLDASQEPDDAAVAALIARVVATGGATSHPIDIDSRSVAGIANLVRNHADVGAATREAAHSVFVVHGHDEAMKDTVAGFLQDNGVRAVVLKDLDTSHPTLFQKFETVGREAQFAIVLISSDDLGTSLREFQDTESGGPASLEYRARQNVVLELGFFFGRLGWDNVFILEKAPPKLRPRFDMPSDLRGVVTRPFDAAGKWREKLLEQLHAKGLAP
jgi:predicted nucleotide-binding protein